jgi:hypothetical protein
VKIITALFALTLATTVSAQTTWRNLRFGMNTDEIRNNLSAQDIIVSTNNEGSLEASSDAQINIPGLIHAIPVRPEFRFTPVGGLMDITLHLDFAATRQNYTQYHTDADTLTFVADSFTRALTGIYGSPIFTTPGCEIEPASANAATCTTTWHGTGQSVSIEWTNHSPHLFIRYQMLSPDL